MGSNLFMSSSLMSFLHSKYVCVCACVSYPSRSRGSRSTVSFGLAVGCWLTLEAPSLHYTLKTFTNATHKRKEGCIQICGLAASEDNVIKTNLSWARSRKRSQRQRRDRWKSRTYDLAVTSTYWPGRKCAAYRGVPEHTTREVIAKCVIK